jgi:hypothetical protein
LFSTLSKDIIIDFQEKEWLENTLLESNSHEEQLKKLENN